MTTIHPYEFQKEIINSPLHGSTFLEGPPASGKTTAAVQRMLYLIERGIPASSILVLVPQRTLGAPYARTAHSPDFPAGSLPEIMTLGGLAQRTLRLFWPAIAQSTGFVRPYQPPTFLTLETAQYYMARIVQPLLDQGYFEQVVIDRNRLYSQILDNLNKSALVGFPYSQISERLKSAWIGKPAQLTIYDQAQECANLFRAFCLENNLLDFSLQLEVFTHQLWPSHLVRQFLNNQYRHLIYDNIEEDVPVAHDIISEWLPDFDSALLIYDKGGGYRAFLGADPDYAGILSERCEQLLAVENNLIASDSLKQFNQTLSASIRRESGLSASKSLHAAFSHESLRFATQLVDWVSQKVAALIQEEGIPPGEIVILAPYLSDSLRFSLMNRLAGFGIAAYSHRPSRSLREEPATQALLTFAKLAHPQWELECKLDEVRSALLQCIGGLDLIRADLITRILYKPKREGGPLLDFAPLLSEVRERITYSAGERYTHLREWLSDYSKSEPVELDIFLARLFGEVLSQPGFGFHEQFESAGVAARLIESVQKFRQVADSSFIEKTDLIGKEYIRMVEDGILAAQYLQPIEIESPNAVFLAPAYTFLISNRPVRIQFWLDVGGMGWWERLYQPLTHPHVLSRHWQIGRPWTDQDEVQANQASLIRLTSGLIQRSSQHIYMCTMKINERGSEERGPILRAVQTILRRMRDTQQEHSGV